MTTQEKANELISEHAEGVPILALAKFIGVQASAMRTKAANMNGKVNYVREDDVLSARQLFTFLPSYVNSNRPLKGDKLEAVNALIKAIKIVNQWGDELPLNESQNDPQITNKSPKFKTNKLPLNESQNDQFNTDKLGGDKLINEPQNPLERSFLNKVWFLTIVIVALILAQSSHFAMYYFELFEGHGMPKGMTWFYGISSGLLLESVGLIMVAHGGSNWWVRLIAFIGLIINSLLLDVWSNFALKTAGDFIGGFLVCAIYPAAILAIAETFTQKK